MKRLNYWVIMRILGALILALVAVVPASADKPEHYRVIIDIHGPELLCGVEMEISIEGRYEYLVWFDKNGEAYGDSYLYGDYQATVTNDGRTLTMHSGAQNRYTWITYEETLMEFSGATWIGTLPGYGRVFGYAGRQVYYETCHPEGDEWVCGNENYHWSGWEIYDWEAVCNYLLNGK